MYIINAETSEVHLKDGCDYQPEKSNQRELGNLENLSAAVVTAQANSWGRASACRHCTRQEQGR